MEQKLSLRSTISPSSAKIIPFPVVLAEETVILPVKVPVVALTVPPDRMIVVDFLHVRVDLPARFAALGEGDTGE
jgi:hypothetical protein